MNGDLPIRFQDLAPRILALVVDPFLQFLFPGSVFWWPFLLTAFAIALAGYWRGRGRGLATVVAFRRRFFGRAVWAHPSAQADYAYYIVNSVLHPVLVAPLIVSGAAMGGWAEQGLDRAFGPAGSPLIGLTAGRALYTFAFFAVYDFARYVGHGLLHDLPFLWQFHKVHHSAEVLTPITNYRAHPVELLVMGIIPNAAVGLTSGIVWYLMAGTIGFYSFAGLHVLLAAFNSFANLRHSHVWISFGPVLNRWLISPAHHQIHHSHEPRHFGRNRGYALAVWDRIFGTLYLPAAEETFRFGLGDGTDGNWHRVGRMYIWPFRYALARLGVATAPRLPRDEG